MQYVRAVVVGLISSVSGHFYSGQTLCGDVCCNSGQMCSDGVCTSSSKLLLFTNNFTIVFSQLRRRNALRMSSVEGRRIFQADVLLFRGQTTCGNKCCNSGQTCSDGVCTSSSKLFSFNHNLTIIFS